jgi:hypothetical protein
MNANRIATRPEDGNRAHPIPMRLDARAMDATIADEDPSKRIS